MQTCQTYLWLGLGGAIGTVARYWIDGVVSTRHGVSFPTGILVINASGSLVIGLLFALFGPEGAWPVAPQYYRFMTIGICGGYTTFSSFSLGVLNLAREREWLHAALYILLSVALSLAAVWIGFVLGTALAAKSRA